MISTSPAQSAAVRRLCHTVRDAELRDAVDALTYHGAMASEEVRMHVRLPIWRRGCGIRSRLSLAPQFPSMAVPAEVLAAALAEDGSRRSRPGAVSDYCFTVDGRRMLYDVKRISFCPSRYWRDVSSWEKVRVVRSMVYRTIAGES